MRLAKRIVFATSATAFLVVAAGCDSGPTLAPVSGRVLLDGEPLAFGYVRLHPQTGPPAQGAIGSNGEFSMSTAQPGDGAPIGRHRVSVICFEGHDPKRQQATPGQEVSLGRPLIPIAYTRSGMSGLTLEVPEDGIEGHTIELNSRGPGR